MGEKTEIWGDSKMLVKMERRGDEEYRRKDGETRRRGVKMRDEETRSKDERRGDEE